jgi:hypothetical protein
MDRMGPVAPVRGTGPASIGIPAVSIRRTTASSGFAARKQRSSAPGVRPLRLGLELAAGLVQVDLLVAEPEGDATLAERLEPQAQDSGVEVDAAVAMTGRQDEVVEVVDHGRCSGGRRAWLVGASV